MRFPAWLLVVCLAGVGCGADCEDLCEEKKDEGCTGSSGVNCEAECVKSDDLAEASECEDAYDDYLSCVDDQDDICDANDECKPESAALKACVSEYCSDHGDTPGCGSATKIDDEKKSGKGNG